MLKTLFATLQSGETEVDITDSVISDDSIFEVYQSNNEVAFSYVSVNGNTASILFDSAPTEDIEIALLVNNLVGEFRPFSGDYEDLTNKPSLFSGDYEDLTNKPNIPHDASDLPCVNPDTLEDDTTQNVLAQVFQSVDSGKTLVASAITDKGIPTLASDTFETIAINISQIETGGGGSGYIGLAVTNYNKNEFIPFKGSGTTAQALTTLEDSRISIYNNQSYLQYRWIDLVGFYVDMDLTDISYISFRTNRTNTNGRIYSFALNTKPNEITSGATISTGSGTYGLINYPTDASGTTNFTLDVRSITGHRYVGLANIANGNTTYCTRIYAYKD